MDTKKEIIQGIVSCGVPDVGHVKYVKLFSCKKLYASETMATMVASAAIRPRLRSGELVMVAGQKIATKAGEGWEKSCE